MLEHHHPRLALACSFQKEEAVLIDMLLKLEPSARVFTIDTGRALPRDLRGLARARAPLWRTRRDLRRGRASRGAPWSAGSAARQRKVAALDAALAELDGWITGLRREQAPTRAAQPEARLRRAPRHLEGQPARRLGREGASGTTSRATTSPYNPLHDRGYESIGLHALHASRRPGARALGRQRQDRVRHPRLRHR